MTNEKNVFVRVLTDLGIEHDDKETNPKEFAARCYSKAKSIATQLDSKSTLSDVETKFKTKAYQNTEAVAEATSIYNQIIDLIVGKDPEVIANLLTMLPEIASAANSEVRSFALRNSGTETLTKKHLHEMYSTLRKCYESFVNYHRLFDTPGFGNPPMIPAKSGNYSTGENSLKLYRVVIDGEPYINPFEAAKTLGLVIHHYMDIVEIVRDSGGTIGEFQVALEEF